MLQSIITFVFLTVVLHTQAWATTPKPLVISTMPFDNPASVEAVFGILNKHLSKKMGRVVRFEPGGSYEEVIKRIQRGEVDVAFMGAASYVKARRAGAVRAILSTIRHQRTHYYGIIIVKRGSSITSVKQLEGKRLAFVDPNSTAGYFFPRKLLKDSGVDLKKVRTIFAGGHHKVVQMVAKGQVDAGACFVGAQETLADADAVVSIARTQAIPGDPVVVRPGLSKELISALRSALIELPRVANAKSFLTFAEIDGFVPAFDSHYDEVATMIDAAGN